MNPQDERQLIEAFIQGTLPRQGLMAKLQEPECGGVLRRIHNHGLQAPRLSPPALRREVQGLNAALSPFLQPSTSPGQHALVVIICDSWVLAAWAQLEEFESRLRIPGVLWFLTDVVNHWAHLPITAQRYPAMASALRRSEVQVINTPSGRVALHGLQERGELERPMDRGCEILAWSDTLAEAEPELADLRTAPENRRLIQFDALEARLHQIAPESRWVMLNADDLEFGFWNFSRVTAAHVSAWEALAGRLETLRHAAD